VFNREFKSIKNN